MKKKYKLEKKKRGCAISSINKKTVKVVTRILECKVMHKWWHLLSSVKRRSSLTSPISSVRSS